jgi:hypothetical protein
MPPEVSGVGDYVSILGEALHVSSGGSVESRYLRAGHDGYQVGTGPADDRVTDLTDRASARALEEAILAMVGSAQGPALVVHYVGYGYQKRGCPVWLVSGLRRVRRRRPDLTLLSVFHEFFATSRRPSTSSFWNGPLQQRLARDLARLSDGAVTSLAGWLPWLRRECAGRVVHAPVFSTVGELEAVRPLEQRSAVGIAFSTRTIGRIDTVDPQQLEAALQVLGVHRLLLVGESEPPRRRSIGSVALDFVGRLDVPTLSRKLADARVGLISYPMSRLTKSTVAAAYLSHGAGVLLMPEDGDRGAPYPYRPGEHFIEFRPDGAGAADLHAFALVASAGRETYRSISSVRVCADAVLDLLHARTRS